jgi:hypothetical protein
MQPFMKIAQSAIRSSASRIRLTTPAVLCGCRGDFMAENQDPKQPNNREGYDPEFEMPDAEQVEKDRAEAEKIYGDKNKKNPAA